MRFESLHELEQTGAEQTAVGNPAEFFEYYEILEIGPGATKKDIINAFVTKSLQYEIRADQESEEKLERLRAAREVLLKLDPATKKQIEGALAAKIAELEKRRKLEKKLAPLTEKIKSLEQEKMEVLRRLTTLQSAKKGVFFKSAEQKRAEKEWENLQIQLQEINKHLDELFAQKRKIENEEIN